MSATSPTVRMHARSRPLQDCTRMAVGTHCSCEASATSMEARGSGSRWASPGWSNSAPTSATNSTNRSKLGARSAACWRQPPSHAPQPDSGTAGVRPSRPGYASHDLEIHLLLRFMFQVARGPPPPRDHPVGPRIRARQCRVPQDGDDPPQPPPGSGSSPASAVGTYRGSLECCSCLQCPSIQASTDSTIPGIRAVTDAFGIRPRHTTVDR